MFEDNGHDRKTFEKIAQSYVPPERGKSNKNNNKRNNNNNNNNNNQTSANDSSIPNNLFEVLPFAGIDISPKEERKPYVVIPYLPNGTYHKLKRSCDKAGINLVSKPGRKLKNVLCSANKTRHDPKDMPGIYLMNCEECANAIYIGQTIRPINVRAKEHERAANSGNWSHSGICQHKQTSTKQTNWTPTVVTNKTNKNKKKLIYDLKVREALEIRRHNSGPGSGLNEDFGAYVKTAMWDPVFHKMRNEDERREGANP